MSTARNTHSQIHTHTRFVGVLQDISFVSFTVLRDSVSSPASSVLSALCFLLFSSALHFLTVKSRPFLRPEQSLLLLIRQTFMSCTSNGGSIHINRNSFSATSKCFLTSTENLSYYNAIIPSSDKLFPNKSTIISSGFVSKMQCLIMNRQC